MKLYKYKTIETEVKEIRKSRKKKGDSEWDRVLTCLKNNQIWFSSLEKLNDPYEFAFKAHLEGREWRMNHQAIREEFTNQFFVFSSCAIKDNPVLWALYANRYRGIAFEFESVPEDRFYPVAYENEPHSFDVRDVYSGGSEKANDFVKNCFFRKSKPWENEKEFRSLRDQKAGYHLLKGKNPMTKLILGHFVKDEMTSFILKEVKALNDSRSEGFITVEKCIIPDFGWDMTFEVLT